jgi:hypothetical protein
MKLEIELNKQDYLQYQLYAASKRKSTKQERIKNQILFPLFLCLTGFLLYSANGDKNYLITFGAISIISSMLSPFFLSFFYKRHYANFINEYYGDKIGKPGTLEIKNGWMLLIDNKSELKLPIKEIKEIVEISTNYFIIINNITSIILTKNNKTRDFISSLPKKYNIKYSNELNWQWK